MHAEQHLVNTEFRPNAPINREQAAKMLIKTITKHFSSLPKKSKDTSFSVQNKMAPLATNSIMSGVDIGLLDENPNGKYKPKQNMTRAEAAAVFTV
ncbi:S-layer homology domain-containing protein [Paenibacillus profundus]|uniref:S-layer homology domain-containing protein n=1 Tax=Paenibacillus profundus TaxID=1173085 RepID=A0ABS8YTF4_9BACL|nr:S-layer homology domain-containing protein [Paenibacillus profundus]MCE5173625.1 S-layer homology domain-containing protein [Paenibacillus profundus]